MTILSPIVSVVRSMASSSKFIFAKVLDKDRTELVVYGPTENVDRFLEDFEEGDLEPFDTVGAGNYDDEDYEAWLNNEVNRVLDIRNLQAEFTVKEA